MNGPVDIPTLDELLADPAKVATLPPALVQTLLYGVAGLLPVLLAQSHRHTGQTEAPATPERYLSVAEVVAQYGVTPDWLYRHKAQMPHSQPSRKVLLFPEEKLRRWFASRKSG